MAEPKTETVPPAVAETKQLRKELDETLQKVKGSERKSRERSIVITKIQEAIMWLGMDLKAMNEEGVPGTADPYPESKNPTSARIEPTADGLTM